MYDLQVNNHGSIVLLQGLTETGQNWLDENIIDENDDILYFAGQIAVEPRYVQDIIDGAESDGLLVG